MVIPGKNLLKLSSLNDDRDSTISEIVELNIKNYSPK
tara:strand:+ start:354 stop:464 length:111 start_codon:yes stop_codon:yes gene_type:complete